MTLIPIINEMILQYDYGDILRLPMNRKVKIAIIGAGTAGLSAYKEASKYTKDIVVIDKGPLGTTCARVGCMPSKLLIHVANEFYKRNTFHSIGILGASELRAELPKVLQYVRQMRDKFTSSVVQFTKRLGTQFIQEQAEFVTPTILKVGNSEVIAEKVIIATGSKSVIPQGWPVEHSDVLLAESIFEQHDIAQDLGVIGGGIIGLELGQALSRLGLNVSLYHSGEMIGGLSDPKVNETAVKTMKKEFALSLNEKVTVSKSSSGFKIHSKLNSQPVSEVLAAVGRRPNLEHLGLDKLELELDEHSIPKYDSETMKIKHVPIYIAGDVNKRRPLLHEAADEGRIAGFNAAQEHQSNQCFKRRTPIRILFSQPNIAVVGKSFAELDEHQYVVGEAVFNDQGRAKIEHSNAGILRVYGTKGTGKLLGAECIAPDGEHMAHLLAWGVQQKMTASEMLQLPFYHPVVEEGMRTALRNMAKKVDKTLSSFELAICNSEAIGPLS